MLNSASLATMCNEPGEGSTMGGHGWPPVALYLLFFVSGWSALTYEISWNRQIGTVLGHTSSSAAVVLSAYFVGLALGSWIGGRASRLCSPGRGYAACEFVAAGWAFLIPYLLPSIANIRSGLDSRYQVTGHLCETVACIVLLAPATIGLGATLPFMNQWLTTLAADRQGSEKRLIRVYASNTLGALLGVLSSTWMLPIVGVVASSQLAAAAAIVCGILAWNITSFELTAARGSRISDLRVGLPLAECCWAAMSGAATMSLEVLYARLFSLVFHNSTYTFSFVLISFLAGISLGGTVAAKILTDRNAGRVRTSIAVATSMLIATSVLGFVWFTRLQYWQPSRSFFAYYFSGLAIVVATTLPVSFALGMCLPATWKINLNQFPGASSSGIVGNLTCINTLAGAIGALLGNFALFRCLGLWHAFGFVAALSLIPAVIRPGARWLVVLLIIPVAAMQLARTLSDHSSTDIRIARWQSDYGLVDLVRNTRTGEKRIQQNLHYRFGGTGSNSEREFRQAHLPLLLHVNPQRALFLGLGTGMTAGGAIPHSSLEEICIIELIPEVVHAAALLKDDNHGLIQNPRTRIIVDDARHALEHLATKFDVIVSDLFVPWESETGYMYTVETFKSAKARLADGGLFCQWLPLYQMGRNDFEMIASSLRHVFPNVTLWWGRLDARRPVLALVGSSGPVRIDSVQLKTRIDSLWQDPTQGDYLLSTPVRLAELYAGDWPLLPGAILNLDEHPRVEFQAPFAHLNIQTLSGKELQTFVKQVIEKLPAGGSVDSSGRGTENLRPRGWQSAVMFPENTDHQ